jgi:ferrochelatase
MTNETIAQNPETEQSSTMSNSNYSNSGYDAILLLSFGGPEGKDEVIPFLENVLRGKNVPRERMEAVAHHYYLFDGVSPINGHCRELIKALKSELENSNIALPVFWGNRNWHPMLADTLLEMKNKGVKKALAFVTSAYSSYSSCRQYLEDIEKAQKEVGVGAPQVDKIHAFYNHPKFIETNRKNLEDALNTIAPEKRQATHIAFTAHSIPKFMSDNCAYEQQLNETATRLAQALNHTHWQMVYQSRSGPATQPWLDPDICDHLKALRAQDVENVVIAPIGFLCDHMEVIYDLDVEAKKLSEEIGLSLVRVKTPGTDALFVEMIKDLIAERLDPDKPKAAAGDSGPRENFCAPDCCPSGRPAMPAGSSARP